MKQSLDGSLPKICRAVRPFDQDGPTVELSLTQDPVGNSHKNLLVWNQLLNWNQTLIKQSLDGPLPKLCLVVSPSDQDDCTAELSLTQDPMGNSHKNHLVWNQQLNQNQTLMEQSLDGPLPKLYPAVTLSHPRWPLQCSCVVIESSFDPGERLQAPGSLWFVFIFPSKKEFFGLYANPLARSPGHVKL